MPDSPRHADARHHRERQETPANRLGGVGGNFRAAPGRDKHGFYREPSRHARPGRLKLVFVRWQDACSPTRIWHEAAGFKNYECVLVESVGWLLDENAKRIVIAQSCDDQGEDRMAGQISAIPRAGIERIWVLHPPQSGKAGKGGKE